MIFLPVCTFMLGVLLVPRPKDRVVRLFQNPDDYLLYICSELVERHEKEFGKKPSDDEWEEALVRQFKKRIKELEIQGRLPEWERRQKLGTVVRECNHRAE